MNALIQLKNITPVFLAMFVLFCLTLSPRVRAVSPAPDGGYPGGNTAEGDNALFNLTTGNYNTATGFQALYRNTTGHDNTANGYDALYSNTTGSNNTANGWGALYYNVTGSGNTANGWSTLLNNTTGYNNTATGWGALSSNTTGSYNTANGWGALAINITGGGNTANGVYALAINTTGSNNTANGNSALSSNTTGHNNTANGVDALTSSTTGTYNTAMGASALQSNNSGSNNTAFGVNALLNTKGSSNVGLGINAGKNLTTGSGNVCIGAAVLGAAGESNITRIGNIYSSVASGRAVYVNSDNKIGTLASTRRVKNDIKPMDKASEAVLALKPVSFRYKKEIDASGTLQFGLVAEEVADVNADLVTRDSDGKPETVRYDAVNAMLLNEFLKEHHQVQDLKTIVAEQQKQIEALTAGLRKVSDQLETGKAAPQMALNNP